MCVGRVRIDLASGSSGGGGDAGGLGGSGPAGRGKFKSQIVATQNQQYRHFQLIERETLTSGAMPVVRFRFALVTRRLHPNARAVALQRIVTNIAAHEVAAIQAQQQQKEGHASGHAKPVSTPQTIPQPSPLPGATIPASPRMTPGQHQPLDSGIQLTATGGGGTSLGAPGTPLLGSSPLLVAGSPPSARGVGPLHDFSTSWPFLSQHFAVSEWLIGLCFVAGSHLQNRVRLRTARHMFAVQSYCHRAVL